jgi:exopolysaccharide biosynthesis polyprenyl glycosylphosphotransferase
MSMTHVVDVVADAPPDKLGVTLPRPRTATMTSLLAAPTVAAPPLAPLTVAPSTVAPTVAPTAAPTVVPPTPLGRRTSSGQRPVWQAVALDLALALVLAATTSLAGSVPLPAALVVAATWPVLLATSGRYRRQALGQGRGSGAKVLLSASLRSTLLVLALAPWLWDADLVGMGILVAALTVASGVAFLAVGQRTRPRVVLAGRPRDVRALLAEPGATSSHDVVAACLTRTAKEPWGDLPTYVGLECSSAVAHHHEADAVVVLPGARLTPTEVRRLHWSLAGVGAELYLGTGLLDVEPQRTRVLSTAGLDVLHVSQPVLDGPRRLLKDVVERTLALGALVLLLPVLAVLAIAIKWETPGPALFRQERIGRDGVPFTMFKLRSMRVDAEAARALLADDNEKDGVLFKITQDPRVSPLGRRLRTYSLDEVPQLWNVVRGDMSLVGPRPALPGEVARYDADPRRRLVVKPGVTGLWQVSGRSDLSWAESVRLDIKYVDNWSLRLDLAILARTVTAVLGHRGAY